MKNITFDFKNSCTISAAELDSAFVELKREIERVINAQSQEYTNNYASLNVIYDRKLITKIEHTVKAKKSLNPTILIVIGIGGSNLGTMAIIEALRGKFYNQHAEVDIYFADTVDTDYLAQIIKTAEKELSSGNNILLNVVTKSGTTTETIANFYVLLELLKKHRPYNYNDFIVVTTDENSELQIFAQKEEITCLEIPKNIGGRYSVFSAVGLFPLALIGTDIIALHKGAQSAVNICTQNTASENPAATSALLLSLLNKKDYCIHDTFLFSVELESLGKWYRQLMAESIGKMHNVNGNIIHNGITPTVSIGSTDLHSMAQLYLSGPYNTFTTFVSVEKNKNDLFINHNESLENFGSTIENKSIATIMNAILQGTMTAYQQSKRPFVHIQLPEKNEYYVAQFMQIKMLEIIYLGFLMSINPFDQPAVELYKAETKKILLNLKKQP